MTKKIVFTFLYSTFYKKRALVETTWLSQMQDEEELDYDQQLKNYINNNLNLKNYNIIFKEKGRIPLFRTSNTNKKIY